MKKLKITQVSSQVFYQAEQSYLQGVEDLNYLGRIQNYDRVIHLHEQFFETYQEQNEESIKKLFLELREFISLDISEEEKRYAYPILYASQNLYQESSYLLLQEEIRKVKKI